MYGMLLAQGKRNDIVRFINAEFLTADWPLIAETLDPKLRRLCERAFALGEYQPGEYQLGEDQLGEDQLGEDQPARETGPAPDGQAKITRDGAVA
jgi:hypothetical protein